MKGQLSASTAFIIHVLLLITVASALKTTANVHVGSFDSTHDTDITLEEQFKQFVIKNKKPYRNNETEYMYRFSIFKDALKRIDALNEPYRANAAPVYGLNKFSDLTPREFKELYLSDLKPRLSLIFSSEAKSIRVQKNEVKFASLPKSVDWRNKSVLTDILNQQDCGACWAFSVVETLEAMYAIKYNTTPPSLSVQQLIDCDKGSQGCAGGDIGKASSFCHKNGVVPASAYPLTDHTDVCKQVPPSVPRVRVDDFKEKAYISEEEDVLSLLANHGPVTVAVDALTWHNYVGGIIQFHCPDRTNHAVQIVGYNLEGEVPYYIVRNSWGSDFGDHGYLYVKYGENMCGIVEQVVSLDATKA